MNVNIGEISKKNQDLITYYTKKASGSFLDQINERFSKYGPVTRVNIGEQDWDNKFCIHFHIDKLNDVIFISNFDMSIRVTMVVTTTGSAFLTVGQRILSGQVKFTEPSKNKHKIVDYYFTTEKISNILHIEEIPEVRRRKINVEKQLPTLIDNIFIASEEWLKTVEGKSNQLFEKYPELLEELPTIRDIFLF